MKRRMIRYRVKPDQVQRNAELVRAVFAELASAQPDGFRYATFQLGEDAASFVHIVSYEGPGGDNPLDDIAAFQHFSQAVRERCEELPVVSELQEVGSYRLFN